MAENQEIVQPEQLHFTDDGVYPGSVLQCYCIERQSRRTRRIALPFSSADSRRTIGATPGGTASIPLLIITARRTKRSVCMLAPQDCDSAASTARPSRSAPATSFSFRRVSRITTSARVRILVLWELTRMDASGICFAVCLANAHNPIAPSQLCRSPITIRSTALTVHCGRSGKCAADRRTGSFPGQLRMEIALSPEQRNVSR